MEGEKEHKLICEGIDCDTKFVENDITYLCEECNKIYCCKCYCKNHFEVHTRWKAYKVQNGKLTPLTPTKVI